MDTNCNKIQENGLQRSASWRDGSRKRSYIPIRNIADSSKPGVPNSRSTIRSLGDLVDHNEDFFELIPPVDVFEDPSAASSDTTNEVKESISKTDPNSMCGQAVRKSERTERSSLKELSSISDKQIDSLTAENREVIKQANTHMPKAIAKSKSNESVSKGKINKKSGVQLKRCLSLYERKRNPHFCKDYLFTKKENSNFCWTFGVLNSGSCVNETAFEKDTPIKDTDRQINMTVDKLSTGCRSSKTKDTSTNKICTGRRISPTPEKSDAVGCISKKPDRPDAGHRMLMTNETEADKDQTSTIASVTSGSMMSSTISLESGSSSELDFDDLTPSSIPFRNSAIISPRQSLIPVLIRPRSATLCVNMNFSKNKGNQGTTILKHERKLQKSVSLYEKTFSSCNTGSSSVSIRIREIVKSVGSRESSSCSSVDDVFMTPSKLGKSKSADIPEDQDDYPNPVPPSSCRSDVFSPREYVQVDQHALKAPESLSSSFDDLLAYLLKGITTDLSKVRSIYRWIVSQNIPLTLTRHDIVDNSPLGFLYNIRERKASYSELMAVMCRKAGIQCVIIHGMAKSVAYDVGDKVTHKKMKNNWNAVFIDGSWRFIHPYWASQAAKGYGTGRWAVIESDAFHTDDLTDSTHTVSHTLNDFFFLTDPDKFITKCFPDDSQWQLLRKHVTKSEFEALPFLQPAFYELKLKTRSHNHCVIYAVNGKVELSLEMPKDKAKSYKFQYKLYVNRDWEAEGEYDVILLDRYLLYYHEDNIAIFEIRFPISGIYKLELHCSDPKRQLPSNWVCDYKIICESPMEICNPLPITPSLGWGLGEELGKAGLECLTHKQALISLDKETVTFVRFALPKDKEVTVEAQLLHNDKSPSELEGHVICEQDGEHATIQITPPTEGEYALRVFARPKSSGKKKNVCNFLMHRTLVIEDPELSDIRQNLLKATEDGDVDTLAYWVDKFIEKDMADRGDLSAAKKKLHLAKLNRDIAEAIARKDLDLLERAMNSISGTSIKRQMSHMAAQAEAMRSRLRRLKRLRHAVLEMDQKTISEMRSYPKPPQAVHGVMAATFLLLGNKEIQLKKWSKVQGLISKRGKESLKRRVADFSSSTVTPAVLKRAKDILNRYDLESVQIASAGAATFYQWAVTMVGEVENDLEKVY